MSKNSILKLKVGNGSLNQADEKTCHFVPLFPGLFIDLDTSVSVDDCDVLIGAEGFGTQFYFHQNRFSKLFAELSPAKKIIPIDRNTGLQIREVISENSENGFFQAIDYPANRLKNPELANALICPDLDFALLFFESIEEFEVNEMTSELIQFVKVSERIAIGVEHRTSELYCVFIEDPLSVFWHQNVAFSEAEMGKERMRALKKITYNSFRHDLDKDTFLASIAMYQKRFQESEIGSDLLQAENQILDSLKNRFVTDHAIFRKKS